MNRHPYRICYDSTQPGNVPFHSLAVVYVNSDKIVPGSGTFAWTQAEVNRMRAVLGISESGDPIFARYARIFAVESGAANAGQLPTLIHARRDLGKFDSIVYCDQADWAMCEHVVLQADLEPDWFIAAPSVSDPASLRSPLQHKQPVIVQNHWGDAFDTSAILSPDLKFTPVAEFEATG